MDQRDPFPRRTATPLGLVPWLVELVRTLPGLVASYSMPNVLDPRSREKIILAVTEVNGCRYCAWIHGAWQDFLGDVDRAKADEAVLTYARACAEEGRPLDPAPLLELLPPDSVRAVRATVVQIEVSNLVGNTVDGLLARLTRKRPLDPIAAVQELAVIGAAVPLAVPLLGLAAGMRAIERWAPAAPEIEMPPGGEANLLAHMLAAAVRSYLGNAGLRMAVLNLPVELAVGVQAGRTTATIRIGRRRVALENGIAGDAHVVLEGEVEPLLRLATGSVLSELGNVRIRPR
jgi:alkylhydroperoxidase family enzyme